MISTSAAMPVKATAVMTPAMTFSRICRRRAAGEILGATMGSRETLLHERLSIHVRRPGAVTFV